jgi:hypothetical protein
MSEQTILKMVDIQLSLYGIEGGNSEHNIVSRRLGSAVIIKAIEDLQNEYQKKDALLFFKGGNDFVGKSSFETCCWLMDNVDPDYIVESLYSKGVLPKEVMEIRGLL